MYSKAGEIQQAGRTGKPAGPIRAGERPAAKVGWDNLVGQANPRFIIEGEFEWRVNQQIEIQES
jgi:hypothetical protein